MTFLVKLSPPGEDDLYYKDGQWTPFKHKAERWETKGEAESVKEAAGVFVPGAGRAKIVELEDST